MAGGQREVLEDMRPWQGGGNIADAEGLIDYVNKVGIENIARYEHELLVYGMQKLGVIPCVRLIGTAADKDSVMSFVFKG